LGHVGKLRMNKGGSSKGGKTGRDSELKTSMSAEEKVTTQVDRAGCLGEGVVGKRKKKVQEDELAVYAGKGQPPTKKSITRGERNRRKRHQKTHTQKPHVIKMARNEKT